MKSDQGEIVKEGTLQWLWKAGIVVSCVALAMPLGSYVVNGSFMRFIGDDYCYAFILTHYGFWQAQWQSYLNVVLYNGNRYALTFFSGLAGLFGPYANAVLPGLAGLAVFILLSLYPVHAATKILEDTPVFQKWARLWDARDQEIRQASQQGIPNIEVMEVDHIIPRVGELSPDPGYWYNGCASGYYKINSISANQPGWDR